MKNHTNQNTHSEQRKSELRRLAYFVHLPRGKDPAKMADLWAEEMLRYSLQACQAAVDETKSQHKCWPSWAEFEGYLIHAHNDEKQKQKQKAFISYSHPLEGLAQWLSEAQMSLIVRKSVVKVDDNLVKISTPEKLTAHKLDGEYRPYLQRLHPDKTIKVVYDASVSLY